MVLTTRPYKRLREHARNNMRPRSSTESFGATHVFRLLCRRVDARGRRGLFASPQAFVVALVQYVSFAGDVTYCYVSVPTIFYVPSAVCEYCSLSRLGI